MGQIHFFTDSNQITAIQNATQGFGPLTNSGGKERYQIQSKFPISANAPAYSITKSIVLAIQDENDPTLLNLALKPLNSSTAGFPISHIIFRGILKSSLIDDDGNMELSDPNWADSNILKIIKELQDKINIDQGTPDLIATSDSLGLQFGNSSDDTFVDSILFNDTDEFHPIIVPAGCEIGKFKGNNSTARIQIILDIIGAEPTFGFMRESNSIFSMDIFTLNTSVSEKEQLRQKFEDRSIREKVLNYVDVTAFYGACRNQNIRVRGVENDDTFLDNFKNKNRIYIDVRDERGFSYNHFFQFYDGLDVGFYNSDGESIFSNFAYYLHWPILTLDNNTLDYPSKKEILLQFPIVIGSPENLNILTVYTGGIDSASNSYGSGNMVLGSNNSTGGINLKHSEAVKFRNWAYSDDKLGANYFLLKRSTLQGSTSENDMTCIWNSFFSLDMKNILGIDGIEDGEYRVKTYAPLCSPPIVEPKTNKVYSPVSGIAADKYNITFFAFMYEKVFEISETPYGLKIPFIATGKYKKPISLAEQNYDPNSQNIGFLHQVVKQSIITNVRLGKYSFDSQIENGVTEYLMNYILNSSNSFIEEVIEAFHAITLSKAEYNAMITMNNSGFSDPNNDYIDDQPLYIKQKNETIAEYEHLYFHKMNLAVGIPSIVTSDEQNYSVYIANHPDEVLSGGNPIEISGPTIKI